MRKGGENTEITSRDIALVKQKHQRRFVKLSLINRGWVSVGTIQGELISGSIDISCDSDIRRSASLTMKVGITSLTSAANLMMNYYIRLFCGILDNDTGAVVWYDQGYYIITKSGYKFDPTTRTLTLILSDLMTDLNGDRGGALHAYKSIVKNSEKTDVVIKEVLKLCGFENTDITPVTLLSEVSDLFDAETSEEDELIPYDLEFSAQVTGYDIVSKIVGLYPYYEMLFDKDGVFVVRRKMNDKDTSSPIMDANAFDELIVSEDISADWNSVKNYIEVWGKDGKCYGEAYDDNPDSPFNVAATFPMRLTVTSDEMGVSVNNIYDRYADVELAAELQKEQAEQENIIAVLESLDELTEEQQQELTEAKAELLSVKNRISQNVRVKGDDLAKQWAERLLYEYDRMNDNITLETIGLSFINDVDFKIAYRSKIDNAVRTYTVTGISHDLGAGTSTLTAVRFYQDALYNYRQTLETPTVTDYTVNGMEVTVSVSAVENATKYTLYIDRKAVAVSTGTTISYTMLPEFEGQHIINVKAGADGWNDSEPTEDITIELTAAVYLVTNDGSIISTADGDSIIISEEGE